MRKHDGGRAPCLSHGSGRSTLATLQWSVAFA